MFGSVEETVTLLFGGNPRSRPPPVAPDGNSNCRRAGALIVAHQAPLVHEDLRVTDEKETDLQPVRET